MIMVSCMGDVPDLPLVDLKCQLVWPGLGSTAQRIIKPCRLTVLVPQDFVISTKQTPRNTSRIGISASEMAPSTVLYTSRNGISPKEVPVPQTHPTYTSKTVHALTVDTTYASRIGICPKGAHHCKDCELFKIRGKPSAYAQLHFNMALQHVLDRDPCQEAYNSKK